MKKLLALLLALFLLGPYGGAFAASFANQDDFLIRNGVLEEYRGSGLHVVIPDGVIEIGDFAFYPSGWMEMRATPLGIESVEIPNSVKRIGNNAFTYSSFEDIVIPKSVVSIEKDAFFNCYQLRDLPSVQVDVKNAYASENKKYARLLPEGSYITGIDREGYITVVREKTVQLEDYHPGHQDLESMTIYQLGLYDSNLKMILDFSVEALWPKSITFFDNMAVVQTKGMTWRATDSFSRYMKSPSGNGKYGVIDRTGAFVIPPRFDQINYLGYGRFEALTRNAAGNWQWRVIGVRGQTLPYDCYDTNSLRPSVWARPEAARAVELGLVVGPQSSMSVNYTWNITRQQFCELALNLYIAMRGPDAPPVVDDRDTFSDTNSIEILRAYQLGIIKGRGNGIFDPFADITRQEAAIMLSRLAALLNISPNADVLNFADISTIMAEGKAAISVISAMRDEKTGSRVMNGMGEGQFAPNDPYTTEQAIVTMLRLYNVAKKD
ncbi:leucine-rich repeat protein [Brevibacillus sp. NRS-1366]|uniref:leucine-rich repeat protein n=1 Tax=Brevibacillus sp. NRS-1366 TaxID=3233899 RepID=UPI003D1A5D7C